jgi:hypothetical protein
MATLVLTAAGTALGGPIGGAVGAILGQQIDGRLFASKARQGPRLGDLAVQTSSYGTAIPKLFGTMRVAGTVIWATDLREQRSTSGGGKGRLRTVDYSYSASFAVALSGRPVRAVRRIWADGKLLRGAAGDFKVATGYRLHAGGEEQSVDPLIASAEGIGETPAYRGVAYAVFEDMQLAEFGNRIPSLSFEVEADPGPVTIAEVASELSGGAIAGGPGFAVDGYAASGDSVRSAVEALADMLPMTLVDTGEVLRLEGPNEGAVTHLSRFETLASSPGAGGRSELIRESSAAVAAEVTVAYHDVGRDYQVGLQRAFRGGAGSRSDRRSLAAALDAGAAKALAELRLASLRAERASAKIHVGWRRSGFRPGQRLTLEGQPGIWRLLRWTLDRMVLTLDLVREAPSAPTAASGSSGRPIAEPDRRHGPTTVLLIDLPLLAAEEAASPRLVAAAAGVEAGWRRAQLSVSFDGGASWRPAGGTPAPAVIGHAVGALPPRGSALVDLASILEIELLNDEMWLQGRSDGALVAGANLAVLGRELIQFGMAEPLGGRRFRLQRLLRGRRGTEWAAKDHQAGEPFLLIEQGTLAPIPAPSAAIGGAARLLASGIGDAGGAEASLGFTGEVLRPPPPVHLRATRTSGGVDVTWVRRSRAGWDWVSGSDTPLVEETEAYRISFAWNGGSRSVTVTQPHFNYPAVEQAVDGAVGPLAIEVVQLGTFAESRPAAHSPI